MNQQIRNTPYDVLNDEEVPEKNNEDDIMISDIIRDQDQEAPRLENFPENGPHLRILLPTKEDRLRNSTILDYYSSNKPRPI